MFSKEDSRLLRQEFWTSFGKSFPRKWLLYNTKIKGLSFKFYFDTKKAFVCLDLEDDLDNRINYWEKLLALKNILLDDYLPDTIYEEEFYLENDFPDLGIDTIIVDDRVVLSTTAGPVVLSGVYTQCDLAVGQTEAPNRTHLLAYAENLSIDANQAFYNGPLYVLYWSSSRILESGTYLVEGITIGDNTEENSLFNLTITEALKLKNELFVENVPGRERSLDSVSKLEYNKRT